LFLVKVVAKTVNGLLLLFTSGVILASLSSRERQLAYYVEAENSALLRWVPKGPDGASGATGYEGFTEILGPV
jgi:hypothetical protein